MSALHSDDVNEDGEPNLAEVQLHGAEVVAWDAATGAPMLVKKQVGKGTVYTFTLWAYPGHEQFMKFAATWVKELAKQSLPEVYVEDPSGEVFWTRWEDQGKNILMLLNTDWTERDNTKEVTIVADHKEWKIEVRERTAIIAESSDGELSVMQYSL